MKEARRIEVVSYDPAWATEFEKEGKRIREALGELAVRLHHIGSTAIPGMHAKPILDFLLEVSDIRELDIMSPALERLGYEGMGEYGIPERRYFRKNDAQGVRTHQIHAFEVENPAIERHLAFRDYMATHSAAAKAYHELKRRLAAEYPSDIEAYMDGKDAFIKEYEAKALIWLSSKEKTGGDQSAA